MQTDSSGSFHSTDHWLEPGAVEVAAIGDFTSGPRTAVAREALEKVVFLYLLKGQARVHLSDAGILELKPDEILVVFPGRILTVGLTAPSNRLMAVALAGKGAVRAALGLGYWDLMRTTERYEGNFMSEIIDRFHAAPDRGRDARVLSQVEHLLSTVWSRIRHGSSDGSFFDIIRQLNQHVCEGTGLTTEAAAAELGISRSKLNSLFIDGMGIRPGEYISRVLLNLTKAELYFTKSPVARVASRFGFSSSSSFAAFFKRMTGQTPATFRRVPIAL